MPMKNPVHPGTLAKANHYELKQVTRQQTLHFEQAFGGSADMWLRIQSVYGLAQASL